MTTGYGSELGRIALAWRTRRFQADAALKSEAAAQRLRIQQAELWSIQDARAPWPSQAVVDAISKHLGRCAFDQPMPDEFASTKSVEVGPGGSVPWDAIQPGSALLSGAARRYLSDELAGWSAPARCYVGCFAAVVPGNGGLFDVLGKIVESPGTTLELLRLRFFIGRLKRSDRLHTWSLSSCGPFAPLTWSAALLSSESGDIRYRLAPPQGDLPLNSGHWATTDGSTSFAVLFAGRYDRGRFPNHGEEQRLWFSLILDTFGSAMLALVATNRAEVAAQRRALLALPWTAVLRDPLSERLRL